MTLDKFIRDSGLADFDETEKVIYFAFYHLRKQAVEEFSASDGAMLAIILKRRKLNASPTADVDARSVYGAEARQMGWSSDSRDRKRGTGSGWLVESGAGL